MSDRIEVQGKMETSAVDSTVKYIRIGKLVIVECCQTVFTANKALGIPSSLANMMCTFRDETAGGICTTCIASNGVLAPSAGSSNYNEGHAYSGAFCYIAS